MKKRPRIVRGLKKNHQRKYFRPLIFEEKGLKYGYFIREFFQAFIFIKKAMKKRPRIVRGLKKNHQRKYFRPLIFEEKGLKYDYFIIKVSRNLVVKFPFLKSSFCINCK